MNQDTENFEKLRRLLTLKRYEQPPPRYFNDFAGQVVARIKAGERGEGSEVIERLLWEAPWVQRIWAAFETKPILAGLCGVGVCGLLLTGMIYSEKSDPTKILIGQVADQGTAPMERSALLVAEPPLLIKPVALEPSSTDPRVAAPVDESLLGAIGSLRAQPANFSFPSR
jgi:hypothetical protein